MNVNDREGGGGREKGGTGRGREKRGKIGVEAQAAVEEPAQLSRKQSTCQVC